MCQIYSALKKHWEDRGWERIRLDCLCNDIRAKGAVHLNPKHPHSTPLELKCHLKPFCAPEVFWCLSHDLPTTLTPDSWTLTFHGVVPFSWGLIYGVSAQQVPSPQPKAEGHWAWLKSRPSVACDGRGEGSQILRPTTHALCHYL